VLSGATDITGEVMMSLTFMAMLHSLCGHRRACLSFFFDPYQPRHDIHPQRPRDQRHTAQGSFDDLQRNPGREPGRMAWILREDRREIDAPSAPSAS
jgi:hypothetical protein